MCSIAGAAGRVDPELVAAMVRRTAYRGPDGQGLYAYPPGRPVVALGHARLAIVDPEQGLQPLSDETGRTWVVTNGEIYNHQALRGRLEARGHRFATRSDAEAVVHLAEEAFGEAEATASRGNGAGAGPRAVAGRLASAIAALDGMYAIALWYRRGDGGGWLALARDPLGIRPLYWGQGAGGVRFASEIKAIREGCRSYREFPPGHVAVWAVGADGSLGPPAVVPHVAFPWAKKADGDGERATGQMPSVDASPPGGADELSEAAGALGRLLEQAVAKRLMADVPVGVLLSGGVDSSLVAAFARRHHPGPLHSFAVGTDGSPDLEASAEVARALGTVHHLRRFGRREAERLLPRVIYHLESFDAPLVRSALANYLVFELASDYVKVTLTGEGADELFGGYESLAGLTGPALDAELARLMLGLHHTNLQRADRMGLAHGVEARVPFLDLEVVNWAFTLPSHLKRWTAGGVEEDKAVVRALARQVLPQAVARRPKAKFSQGSGAAALLRDLAQQLVSDGEWARLSARFPDVPLASREQALYFRLFVHFFPERAARRSVGVTRSVVPGEVA